MANPFPYSLDNKRYNTWNYFLKNKFGKKVYKVPLSLGNTCPNRDGTKAVGGCTFCLSGGGGTAYIPGSFKHQFDTALKPLEAKWPEAFTMPYFQSFSNTYLSASLLKSALYEALALPNAVGICVATRPDCLPNDIVKVLSEINKKTFLIVELGLQTIHSRTAELINRGHSFDEFLAGYNKLKNNSIPVCIHLINGLPFETQEMMIETVKVVSKLSPHSVKFHMLHILSGTALEKDFKNTPFHLLTREEYVDIVVNQLELLPPATVIQRVTGDPPRENLIEPQWTLNKLWVRNAIDIELVSRDSFQGINFTK